jgi:hypothetical protein
MSAFLNQKLGQKPDSTNTPVVGVTIFKPVEPSVTLRALLSRLASELGVSEDYLSLGLRIRRGTDPKQFARNRPSPLCSPHIAAVANVCQRQPSNPERRVTKGSAMGTYFPEPTLAELLSDPVTRAVMRADGVNPWELEEMLRGLAQLRAQSSPDTNLRPATSPRIPRL